MNRFFFRLLPVLYISLLGGFVTADNGTTDILDQQKELQQIKSEVEHSQSILDSLQSEGLAVSRRISEYDQKISSDRKIITRLNSELSQLRSNVESATSALGAREIMLERLRRRFLGNVRQYYVTTANQSAGLSYQPNAELEKHRQVVYLTALAGYESQSVVQATDLLATTTKELNGLSGRSEMVSDLKKKKETSVALERSQRTRRQRDLDQLQRKSSEEADRILTLREAAQEMEAIIARLEMERQRATQLGQVESGPSIFAALKGQLPSPYSGKIVVKFGSSVDPVTRLNMYSPSISIKGRARGAIRAMASGTVAYAGELRGYGNFVIISHDNQYYTTYAGLGSVLVSRGQYLQARTKIGEATDEGVVKLEIRKGRESLDPVEWIQIESF